MTLDLVVVPEGSFGEVPHKGASGGVHEHTFEHAEAAPDDQYRYHEDRRYDRHHFFDTLFPVSLLGYELGNGRSALGAFTGWLFNQDLPATGAWRVIVDGHLPVHHNSNLGEVQLSSSDLACLCESFDLAPGIGEMPRPD